MKLLAAAVFSMAMSTSAWAETNEPPPVSPPNTSASDVETVLNDMQAFVAPRVGLVLAPAPHGELLVIGIEPGSPAARAGLRRGDFILQIDGQQVPSLEKLKSAIETGKPRDSVSLSTWRGGKESELNILLLSENEDTAQEQRPWAGLQVDEVPGKGLVVKALYPGGPAAKAGLQEGDVIVSADGTEIDSFVDAEKFLRDVKPMSNVKVVVNRDGERKTLTVEMASLRATPEGLSLESAGDGELSNSNLNADSHHLMLELARREAEQRQRLEQLLQEIRHEVHKLRADFNREIEKE